MLVTIDRLALNGFPPQHREAIATQLTVELQRQLSMLYGAKQLGASRSVVAMVAVVQSSAVHTTADHIGSQAAQALARKLSA
jgi:hypothetical protein